MIDYEKLVTARNYYAGLGFEEKQNAPWVVGKAAWEVTSPEGAVAFGLPGDESWRLVASGEQSFLHLILDGSLSPGNYQCITPCFRDGSSNYLYHSELNRMYFMKLELINTTEPTPIQLEVTVEMCRTFFRNYLPCSIIKTDQSETDPLAVSKTYDIVSQKGIELGSYGIREYSKKSDAQIRWLYATGCAEPRLSQAIAAQGLS